MSGAAGAGGNGAGGDGAGVIALAEIEPVDLGPASWSRVLLTDRTAPGNTACLGYSVFAPGLVTADLSHAVEELAYVVSGAGQVRLPDRPLRVAAGQAIYIPARLWHTVVNDGDEDLVMVFAFPSANYPPTQRRPARGRPARGRPARDRPARDREPRK